MELYTANLIQITKAGEQVQFPRGAGVDARGHF
jgi:hypothetical protein